MGVGHEKLNYGDTNIFTLSHRNTPENARTDKQTDGRTDSSRIILIHFDLKQLSSGID